MILEEHVSEWERFTFILLFYTYFQIQHPSKLDDLTNHILLGPITYVPLISLGFTYPGSFKTEGLIIPWVQDGMILVHPSVYEQGTIL